MHFKVLPDLIDTFFYVFLAAFTTLPAEQCMSVP
jgi:hypothetical protein